MQQKLACQNNFMAIGGPRSNLVQRRCRVALFKRLRLRPFAMMAPGMAGMRREMQMTSRYRGERFRRCG